MNYSECMDYIDEITKNRGISLGLDNMDKMLNLIDRPENNYKIIHVCGTNGKGSISAFVAAILAKAGYKVGRYVSPVVTDYCEKIQFSENDNITYVDKEDVASYISRIKETADNNNIYPTPFEVETLMSLIAFKEYKVDWAIIECGMGGLYDATNAIAHKELCIFSTIALDHMHYLGDTIEKIARDKTGIIKQGVKVVSSPQSVEVKNILYSTVHDNSTSVVYADGNKIDKCKYLLENTSFGYKNENYSIKLLGKYQVINAITAIEAIKALDCQIDDEDIKKGLEGAKWNARFEIVSKKPYIIYDGAHNPNGMKAFVESVNELFDRDKYKRVAIVGMFADKDIETMAEYMKNQFDEIHTITAQSNRALEARKLAKLIVSVCDTEVISHPDKKISDIIKELEKLSRKEKTAYFVFGSLSIYNEVKKYDYR